jgi:salicylate hydroxylase
VVEPEGMSFLRWEDGKKIAYTRLVPDFRQNFEAPYLVAHRADFHNALCQLALELGVIIHTNSKVDVYDANTATVHVQNGKSYSGDLIVAADGQTFLIKHLRVLAADIIQGSNLPLDVQFYEARMFLLF